MPPTHPLKRFWLLVPLVAFLHFLVQVFAIFTACSPSMDPLESRVPILLQLTIHGLCILTSLPLLTFAYYRPLGGVSLLGWLVFLANSYIWGLGAWLFLRRIHRPTRRPNHCPSCGYNLHGLTRNDCPECGAFRS